MSLSDKGPITFVLLLASACHGAVEDGRPQLVELESALSVADACLGERYVGIRGDSSPPCPVRDHGNWIGGPMFTAQPGESPVPSELASYCMYTWMPGGQPQTGLLPDLGSVTGTAWLEPDCDVVGPFGHPFEVSAAQALSSSYHEQIEATPLPEIGTVVSPTKVVIVDSAIDTGFPNPGDGFLEHGHTMGTIVRDLGCPAGGSCRTAVSTKLALPLLRIGNGLTQRDEAHGGELGMFSDVALGVFHAYRSAATAGGDDRIIINLSLGWAPVYGGAFPSNNWNTLKAPIRAVYSAIAYASCRGAIVIAASGNNPGGPGGSGAAFPAAWESKPAPGPIRCIALGGGGPVSSTTTYRPFLYAAGGVDARDLPLMSTRNGGMPSVVAPAAHTAVVGGTNLPTVYHGSSLGAAGVSAVAAVAWSYLPNRSPHDILALVMDYGVDLPFAPDFCISGVACRQFVSRVSMCKAVDEACALRGDCTFDPNCLGDNPGRDARPIGLDLSFPLPQGEPSASGLTFAHEVGDPCNTTVYSSSIVLPQNPCPAKQFFTQYAAPYVHPQPPNPICPTCLLTLGGELIAGITTDPGGSLTAPSLTVVFLTGYEKTYALDIDRDLLAPGSTFKLTDLDVKADEVAKASISFVINGTYASSDQLLIERE